MRIDRPPAEAHQQKRPTVRVEELGEPDAGSTGTLTGSKGGLGLNLWRGATFSEIVGLMRRLPSANRSMALHDLQRRLLLTVAMAPAEAPATAFAQARLNALMTMGASRDVVDLARRTKMTPARPYPVIRARFLTGDHKGACTLTAAVRERSAFVEMAQITCHVLGGEAERAEIALRLLHEQGAPADSAFETAVAAAAAARPPDGIGKPYALTIALLTQAKAVPGTFDLRPVPIAALVALSADKRLKRLVRIRALEAALARGAPVDRELSALYAAANGGADKVVAATLTRLKAFDVRSRASLYSAAAAADNVSERLRILSAWWRLADAAAAKGDTAAETLAARQTTPFLKDIEPDAAHQDHAASIARACFATGRVAAALAWYRVLKSAPFRNPADLHRVTALAVISAQPDNRLVERWYAFRRGRDVRKANSQLADLKALLEGLGREQAVMPLWRRVAAKGPSSVVTPVDRYRALRDAAVAGQRGMTLLHVLTLVNGRALQHVPRRLLREAVAGLRIVGLERDARQLALEAALARRL